MTISFSHFDFTVKQHVEFFMTDSQLKARQAEIDALFDSIAQPEQKEQEQNGVQ